MTSKTSLNVLSKQQLTQVMRKISSDIATVISHTYGPYGANTLIQGASGVYFTKDGWMALQNLNYPNNALFNALKKLFLDCAQSVLLYVGDGTSTVTLLANEIYQQITMTPEIIKFYEQYNVKDIETCLNEIVKEVSNEIYRKGHTIDDGSAPMEQTIRNMALISTNWDAQMAGFISDIYKNTKNPIIKFENSGTEESYVKYISGYEIKGHILLKDYHINKPESGKCQIDNPVVLVFNYTIGKDMSDIICTIASTIKPELGKDLVVIAPDFAPDFVNCMKTLEVQSTQSGKGHIPCRFFRYDHSTNIDKDCVDDLCFLLGATQISYDNTDLTEMVGDLKSAVQDRTAAIRLKNQGENISQDTLNELTTKCLDLQKAATAYIKKMIGTCECIEMTDKYLLISGLSNSDMEEIEKRKASLQHEIDIKTKECAALSMITEGIRLKRVRLGKLQLNMGVIYVGGFGDSNLKSKRDALDDATRACEAVYQSGYTIGGGIAPIIALEQVKIKYPPTKDKFLQLKRCLIDHIHQAYFVVMMTMCRNKWTTASDPELSTTVSTIIYDAKSAMKGYNLFTTKSDDTIISPTLGEVEILKGSMTLVTAMITADQMIFQDMYSIDDLNRLVALEQVGNTTLDQAAAIQRISSSETGETSL